MVYNFLKIAFRNILRNKTFSLINISGLAIGIAVSFMMMLIVFHETSFDKHNDNYENVGRVIVQDSLFSIQWPTTPFTLVNKMIEDFPEIKKAGRAYDRKVEVELENKSTKEVEAFCVDLELFEILTIPLITGDINNLKEKTDWILLAESAVPEYVSSGSPIGERINMNIGEQKFSFIIAGVFQDFPETSTLNTTMLLPINVVEKDFNKKIKFSDGITIDSWYTMLVHTYFLLDNKTQFKSLNKKLHQLSKKVLPYDWQRTYTAQPMEGFYFNSDEIINYYLPRGDRSKIFIITSIALLILLIAILNFVMLSSAKTTQRYKEIGVRKVLGASKAKISLQIILESILIIIISFPIALLIIEYVVPELNSLLQVSISKAYYHSASFYIFFVLFGVFIGLASGFYISIIQSKLNPIEVLRNKLTSKPGKYKARHAFIIIQLSIFCGLLVSVFAIQKQLSLFNNVDTGFNRNSLYVLDLTQEKITKEKFDVFKNELRKIPAIKKISGIGNVPLLSTETASNIEIEENNTISYDYYEVDPEFIETMGIEILEGRNFDESIKSDLKESIILNSTLAKILKLKVGDFVYNSKRKVIAVIKDFNFMSLHNNISPMALRLKSDKIGNIVLRLEGITERETINKISKIWNDVFPEIEYEFYPFNEKMKTLYNNETQFATILSVSTGLAIFITCLGLFGLILFITEQRTKEIGIRKVLGASAYNIVKMFVKEFLVLVIISTSIAAPLTYYFISSWLNNFAYKTSVGFEVYLLVSIIAFCITLATIGVHVIRTSNANPIKSLRSE